METETIFAERLKQLRDEKDLSQTDLAYILKISRSSIGYYEMEKRLPDIDVLSRIAQHFGVTSDYLIGLSDCRTSENHNIVEELGLTEKAVEKLKETKTLRYEYETKKDVIGVLTFNDNETSNVNLGNKFGTTFLNLNNILSIFIEDKDFSSFLVSLSLYMNSNKSFNVNITEDFLTSSFCSLLMKKRIASNEIICAVLKTQLNDFIDKFKNCRIERDDINGEHTAPEE